MNTRTFVGFAAAIFLAAATPSAAYHIDGETPGGAAAGSALTSGDWELGPCAISPTTSTTIFCLTACESEWGAGTGVPAGTASDDRNPTPLGRHGTGGLCTTGRNDASGEAEPVPLIKDDWTQLDICTDTTVTRNGGVDGPYLNGGAPCSGVTNNIGFTAEIGIYSCVVPMGNALVYQESYAAMSFDGDGSYTPGDAPGMPHTGDGTPNNPAGVDHYQAWTGHVSVFINSQDAAAASVTQGSVETSIYTPAAALILPCGNSPGGIGTPMGPVGIL